MQLIKTNNFHKIRTSFSSFVNQYFRCYGHLIAFLLWCNVNFASLKLNPFYEEEKKHALL